MKPLISGSILDKNLSPEWEFKTILTAQRLLALGHQPFFYFTDVIISCSLKNLCLESSAALTLPLRLFTNKNQDTQNEGEGLSFRGE